MEDILLMSVEEMILLNFSKYERCDQFYKVRKLFLQGSARHRGNLAHVRGSRVSFMDQE